MYRSPSPGRCRLFSTARTLLRICLRIARIFRSNASWSLSRGWAATIAWRITGIVSMTRSPSPVRSVGTSRQPISGLALGGDHRVEMVDGELARGLLLRQEAHRDGVAPGRRQLQPHLVRPVAQQAVGHLDQAAGAVAHQRVGADRAAMVEVDQDLQAAADDLVRLSALDVGHEADAARIVFVAWIIQSLARRKFHRRSLFTCRRRRNCPAGSYPSLLSTRNPAGPATRSSQATGLKLSAGTLLCNKTVT